MKTIILFLYLLFSSVVSGQDIDWMQIAKESSDPNEKIGYYTKIIEMGTAEKDVFLFRGEVKFSMKDYQGSISDYNTAIELDSKFIAAYVNRSLALLRLNDIKVPCQIAIRQLRSIQEMPLHIAIEAKLNSG